MHQLVKGRYCLRQTSARVRLENYFTLLDQSVKQTGCIPVMSHSCDVTFLFFFSKSSTPWSPPAIKLNNFQPKAQV